MLSPEFPDFALRVGVWRLSADGQRIRVVLIIGPRQVIARPLRWIDHAWMPFARLRDARMFGMQQRR